MILLQGMCYAGKTTCGNILATSLGIPFLDSRDLFQRTHNMSEIDFLDKYGRDRFCEAEENTLQQDLGDIVLSLGGSACYYDLTMANIAKKHTIVWLDVPFEIILKRKQAENKQRPVVFPRGIQTFQALYDQRKQLYEKYATHRVSVTDEQLPYNTVSNIIKCLKS